MFDETSFAKIEVTGPDAAAFMNWVCDNDVARAIGDVTYTQALNSRGGIEADFTVTRTGADSFLVITGTAFGTHDIAWLRKQARRRASRTSRIADITGSLVCYGVWGPRARDLLTRLTPADLSNEAFPFMTSQEITVADVPLRAVRVTFVGELGWELYASTEYGAGLWSIDLGRRGRPRTDARRLSGHREPAAGEGLPGLEHRPHPRDHAVRGRDSASASSSTSPAASKDGTRWSRRRPPASPADCAAIVLDDPRRVAARR